MQVEADRVALFLEVGVPEDRQHPPVQEIRHVVEQPRAGKQVDVRRDLSGQIGYRHVVLDEQDLLALAGLADIDRRLLAQQVADLEGLQVAFQLGQGRRVQGDRLLGVGPAQDSPPLLAFGLQRDGDLLELGVVVGMGQVVPGGETVLVALGG